MQAADMNALLASAAIANALVCGFSLLRGQGLTAAAYATGLGFCAMAFLLIAHWG